MQKDAEIESFILSVLSFYEPMTFSKIIFDLPNDFLLRHKDFDRDQLLLLLISLEKRGLVKKIGKGIEAQWLRTHKKRSLFNRILLYKK